MKVTRILPKSMAIAYQEYDIEKKKAHFEYYSRLTNGYKQLLDEAYEELSRLESES